MRRLRAQRQAPAEIEAAVGGIYVTVDSHADIELKIESMAPQRKKDPRERPEVVRATRRPKDLGAGSTQRAVLFVPDGHIDTFFEQLEKYTGEVERGADTYDRVAALAHGVIEHLWSDDPALFPQSPDEVRWWEVWLRRVDDGGLKRFQQFAAQKGFDLGPRVLVFAERIVVLAHTSAAVLGEMLQQSGDIAELQAPRDGCVFLAELPAFEQAEWAKALAAQVVAPGTDAPAVCLLDTGTTRAHPLLQPALRPEDLHTVNARWGTDDKHGHGTLMSGLAIYGDLGPVMQQTGAVEPWHRLESVKLLPRNGANAPVLYAALTADAVARPEIEAPHRRRVYAMAVTSGDGRDHGEPTSWSAAVDALAAGFGVDADPAGLVYLDEEAQRTPRLFVVSAGNVDPAALQTNHLDVSDLAPVQDPAHAWNVLTVGAYTERISITDPDFSTYQPVTAKGDLSPWSSTGVQFPPQWPNKPDVVMEGGNVAVDPGGVIDTPGDLQVLTTERGLSPLGLAAGTSAATAQVAAMAADLAALYPDASPELLRALLVHSARWTPPMTQALGEARLLADRCNLLRRYGHGVPDLERAARSGRDALVLTVEDTIRPFESGKMREMHFHALPWPAEALLALGETEVTVRVTLSHFIMPNPGRRSWQKRHRYQSHGLRFDLRLPTETQAAFEQRLNHAARDEAYEQSASGAGRWFFGEAVRHRGSLHSDILRATAADVAACGAIGVFPVSGWWYEQPKRDRSADGVRYALVVSIETDAIDVDLYTPVQLQLDVPVAIET